MCLLLKPLDHSAYIDNCYTMKVRSLFVLLANMKLIGQFELHI